MTKIWLVFNKVIPFKGYNAITFYPWVFVRKDASKWALTDTRHETTHLWQQEEVLMLGYCATTILAILGIVSWWWLLAVPFYFYVGYVLEWLIRIPICGFDTKLAYFNISTEQESYLHEDDLSYNYERKRFAWVKYLFKKSFIRNEYSHKIVKRQ
jgi:hypothetical protein